MTIGKPHAHCKYETSRGTASVAIPSTLPSRCLNNIDRAAVLYEGFVSLYFPMFVFHKQNFNRDTRQTVWCATNNKYCCVRLCSDFGLRIWRCEERDFFTLSWLRVVYMAQIGYYIFFFYVAHTPSSRRANDECVRSPGLEVFDYSLAHVEKPQVDWIRRNKEL